MSFSKRIERAVDYTVGLVSPRRRAISKHFARMDSDEDYRDVFLAMMRARGYRAAESGKYGTPFIGSSATADAEILTDLPALSARSQELNRDDPLACGLTWTFVRNVIGTGMRPQSRTGDGEKDRAHEELWEERKDELNPADDLTHAESQRMRFWKTLEDGNVFVKRVSGNGPVWFESVEKSRVTTPPRYATDKNIRDGVKRDDLGRILGYFILKAEAVGTGGLKPEDYDFFDKSAVRHLRLNITRPGQTHGVPLFHAVTKDLRDLDLLILASLKRIQVSACLSAFITSPKSLEDIFDLTAQDYGYKLDQTLEPGMIFRLFPDETITTLSPNFPNSEFEPFIVLLARRIGASLGISWQIVLKDFSQSTYSSARTDLLEARQAYKHYQSWFIDKLLDWEWFSVLEDAKLRGDARVRRSTPADMRAVHWIPNGWDWIDPDSEANAVEKQLALKITTLREECAARGKDWEETLRQSIAEEKAIMEMREEAGLPAIGAEGEAQQPGMSQEEIEKSRYEAIKAKLDAYGIGVRAGVVTPQEADESAIRDSMELPPASPNVGTAWKDDGGIRRPITLQQKGPDGEVLSPLAKAGQQPKKEKEDAGNLQKD